MRLRTRLTLALLPLAAVLAALGTAAIRSTAQMGELSDRILRDNYRSVLAAQRMKESLERLEGAASYRLAGQAAEAALQEKPSLASFEEELKAQEANVTEVGEGEATQRLRALWAAYREEAARFRALPAAEQREAWLSRLEPAFRRAKEAADVILDLNQDAMVRKSDEARGASRTRVAWMALATLLAVLLGVLSSGWLTERALRPLAVLTHAVRRLGEGDLAARALVRGEDEVATLAQEFNTLAQRLGDYRRSSLGELLQAQQASQAAIDSLPDPVVVLANDGRVSNVNTAAAEMLRLAPDAAAGVDPLAVAQPALRAVLEKVRAHVASGKGPWMPRGFEESVRLESPAGDRWLLPRATPVYSEEGGVVGASIVLQDVTRLRRFDELKNDLVATVAHEFRTPLTSLRMAIHLCLEGVVGPLNEKQTDLLWAARADCERLQAIVDDLLDLSRIQAGKVEVVPEPTPPQALIDALLAERRDEAARAGVQLSGAVAGPLPAVLADRERIGLVLANLVSNALKHAPAGTPVELGAEPWGAAVRFTVTDRGPGVPREQQQRIFEKFVRLPGERGEGVGLGLYIAREIVRAHGGEVGVESEPGHGARFWFTLPAAPPEAGPAA